ncbi:hypothetical protein ACFL2D_02200 [Patescibacteria group bacterium]
MRFKVVIFMIFIGALVLVGAGCSDGDDRPEGVEYLSFEIENLHALKKGTYEAWVFFRNEKTEISLGKFRVNEEGKIQDLEGTDIVRFQTTQPIKNADSVYITIEKDEDENEASSGIIVLSGEIQSGMASMEYREMKNDFTPGGMMVAVSDNNAGETESRSDLYNFTIPRSDTDGNLLELPENPSGWIYALWVRHGENPILLSTNDDSTYRKNIDAIIGMDRLFIYPIQILLGESMETRHTGASVPVNASEDSIKFSVTLEPNIDGNDPSGRNVPSQFEILSFRVPAGKFEYQYFEFEKETDHHFPKGKAYIE